MFRVEIDTSNVAFQGNMTELQALLYKIGVDLKIGITEGAVIDTNGTKVGTWGFYDDE